MLSQFNAFTAFPACSTQCSRAVQKVDDTNLLLLEVKGVYQVQSDSVMMESQDAGSLQHQLQHGHDVSSSPYTSRLYKAHCTTMCC